MLSRNQVKRRKILGHLKKNSIQNSTIQVFILPLWPSPVYKGKFYLFHPFFFLLCTGFIQVLSCPFFLFRISISYYKVGYTGKDLYEPSFNQGAPEPVRPRVPKRPTWGVLTRGPLFSQRTPKQRTTVTCDHRDVKNERSSSRRTHRGHTWRDHL